MFSSLHNVTLSRPRICLESLLEHFIFQKISWQTPSKERLRPINIHTIKFRNPHLQILYAPMLWPLCICITVCKCDKSMLMCAIIIIKDHKMKQIINVLPKINQELYLSSSIIKNVTAGLQRFFYVMLPFCLTIRGHICPMIPINDNGVLNNHDHKIPLPTIHIVMCLECFRRHLNSL